LGLALFKIFGPLEQEFGSRQKQHFPKNFVKIRQNIASEQKLTHELGVEYSDRMELKDETI
jgi:hypothetical protein